MRLHRNAALSWSGRRLLAVRVVDQGWTLTAAAAASGVSVRCARKWVGRYRVAGEAGLVDRSSAPQRVANRTPFDRVAVILSLRGLRMTAAEIAETLADAALNRVGCAQAQRRGQARPDRARAADPLRALSTGRARPYRHQKARPDRRRSRQTRRRPPARQEPASPQRAVGKPPRHDRLGVRPRRRRRPLPARLRRGAPRRESHNSDRLPPPRRRLLQTLRHHRRARPHRQRLAPTSQRPTRSPAGSSASATSAPGHAAHKQTAKPSVSSAPCSTAGPTAPSTAQATNAPRPLTAGSGTTTIDVDTQPSATNPRSAEPTCLGPTSSCPL